MSKTKIFTLTTGSVAMLTLLLFYIFCIDLDVRGATYFCPNGTSTPYTASSPSCGDGLPDAFPSLDEHQAETNIVDDQERCINLYSSATTYNDAHKYAIAYDTIKEFMEHCYMEKLATVAFSASTNSVIGLYDQGAIIMAAYRDWLKKVLYYNPDSSYYCADLLQYATTFEFKDETGKEGDFKTTLAIMKYIIDSSHCSLMRSNMNAMISHYHLDWKDTVTDSLKTPFDTNYASLDELNQTFLRGFARDVDIAKPIATGSLGELTAEKNPFTTDAIIHYITNAPTVAKLEVYDALGKMLWTNGQGYLEPGEHIAAINGSQWSSGTYYVRLVTLKGEIRTCKLIKE